jgi:hypothetical protein
MNAVETLVFLIRIFRGMLRRDMKTFLHSRRGTVIVCLAAVLFAAITPLVPSLFLFVFVAPLWFFSAATVSSPLRTVHEQIFAQQFPASPAFSPRPPPAL